MHAARPLPGNPCAAMIAPSPHMPRTVSYSTGEEIANSITHGLGAAFGVAGLAVLVTLAAIQGDALRVVSFSVYGASLVTLYLFSTCYHGVRAPRLKRFFRVMDHSAIFLFIAGTYTPFTLVSLQGGVGWWLFGVIWGLAATGILLKLFFTGRFGILSTIVYVAMGWCVLVAIKPVVAAIPFGCFLWLLVGGLSYTLGLIFYAAQRLPYNHAVWHVFVMAGSAAHFIAIFLYVLPVR